MAQTTGAMYGIDAKIEVTTNGGSTWTDFSGQANKIEPGDSGARDEAAFYTFDGEKAIIKEGKRKPVGIEVTVAYTENDAELFEIAHGCYVNKTIVQMRWTMLPTSVFRWKSDPGYITKCPVPAPQAEKPDVIAITFRLYCPGVEEETVSGSPSVS